MRVVALKPWSNGSVSMEERQVAELPDALANDLIEQGIVEQTALPATTPADVGKVLSVDENGVIVPTEPGGGGDANTVTVTITKQSGSQYTLDRPASEIKTLINNGIKVLISDGFGVGAARDTGAYINAWITYVMPMNPPTYNADVLVNKQVSASPNNTTATVSEKTYTLTAYE